MVRDAQRQQRGLHVGGALRRRQLAFDPVEMELVAAGALGRRQREPGLVEQAREQGLVDAAAGGERAVAIEAGAGMAQAPGIHQPLAGPVSKPRTVAARAATA